MPRVKSTSFTDTGTPCSRPSGSPFITAISASRARRRATSCATRAKALRRGLTASMRARTASVSSTGDSSLRRIKAAHSTAERQTTSSAAIVTSSPPRHCIIRPVAADATRMRRDAAGRPAGEQDRHGSALSALEWSPDGRLSRASVRLPDGGWVSIEPGAGAAGPWGASDLVTRDGRPLTRLAALDWARVVRIPPLAEPARLPAGAGTAIFNLLARLAAEQGVAVLRYDAPYPTEALFLAPEIVAGLVATVVATSAPALAPWIAGAARDVEFQWGPVHADLVEVRDARVRLSHRLRRALGDAVRGRSRADALATGLAALREAADLVADGLRARAQGALAAEPADVQVAALEHAGPPSADARAIAAAAEALAREAARG